MEVWVSSVIVSGDGATGSSSLGEVQDRRMFPEGKQAGSLLSSYLVSINRAFLGQGNT